MWTGELVRSRVQMIKILKMAKLTVMGIEVISQMNKIIISLVFDIVRLKLKIMFVKIKRLLSDIKIYYLTIRAGFIFYWRYK